MFGLKLLGAANLLSIVAAQLFFEAFLISVWCFFAAILSMMILEIIARNNRKKFPEIMDKGIQEMADHWNPID